MWVQRPPIPLRGPKPPIWLSRHRADCWTGIRVITSKARTRASESEIARCDHRLESGWLGNESRSGLALSSLEDEIALERLLPRKQWEPKGLQVGSAVFRQCLCSSTGWSNWFLPNRLQVRSLSQAPYLVDRW